MDVRVEVETATSVALWINPPTVLVSSDAKLPIETWASTLTPITVILLGLLPNAPPHKGLCRSALAFIGEG